MTLKWVREAVLPRGNGEKTPALREAGPRRAAGGSRAPRVVPLRPDGGRVASKLGPLPGLLGYQLRRAQEAVFADFAASVAARLNPAALTPGQFGLLAIVAANPGCKQIELGQAMGVDRSTVVAAVDKLEKRGLIERRPVAHDRRAHALNLTADGARVYKRALLLIERHEAHIAAGLTEAERAELARLLVKVAEAAKG